MRGLLAQGTPIGNLFGGIGPLGNTANITTNAQTTASAFTRVISVVLGVLTVSAGLWFIFQVFSGSLAWLSSGGDKQAVQNAQKRISHAIIGLVMVILSYALISIVGFVFGFNILNFYPIFITLTP